MAIALAWKIVAVALAKKATLYALGRTYGFPRLYRRLLEFNRRTISDRSVRKSIQDKVKYFFRIPNKVGRTLGVGVLFNCKNESVTQLIQSLVVRVPTRDEKDLFF